MVVSCSRGDGLVHQRCVCRGAERRWEAAQRVSLFLTAPRQQATPTGTGGRSRHTVAPPTQTRWFTHLDAVSDYNKVEDANTNSRVRYVFFFSHIHFFL